MASLRENHVVEKDNSPKNYGSAYSNAFVGVLIFLCGCGSPQQQQPFVNQTPHSMAYLVAQWQVAQHRVATEAIQLNPVQAIQTGAAPVFSSPNSAAYSIQPNGLLVAALPDATPEQIFQVLGITVQAPTQMILCPHHPCNELASNAFSTYGVAVYYAETLDTLPNAMPGILDYELDTQVLYALGYDVSWR